MNISKSSFKNQHIFKCLKLQVGTSQSSVGQSDPPRWVCRSDQCINFKFFGLLYFRCLLQGGIYFPGLFFVYLSMEHRNTFKRNKEKFIGI